MSSARISRWVVTSSAVDGSSAIRIFGSRASAAAMPDALAHAARTARTGSGRRRRHRGCRPRRGARTASLRRAARPSLRPRSSRSCSSMCLPQRRSGLSIVNGSWKMSPISAPRSSRSARSGSSSRSRPVVLDLTLARTTPPAAARSARAPSSTCRCRTRRRCRSSRRGASVEIDAGRRSCATSPPMRARIREIRRRVRSGSRGHRARPRSESRSYSQSPIRFMRRRRRSTITHAGRQSRDRVLEEQRAVLGRACAPSRRFPDRTPRPRKESAESVTRLNAKFRNVFATTTGSTFGQTCPTMICARLQAEHADRLDVGTRPLLEHRAADQAGVVRDRQDHQQRDGQPVAAAQHADDDDRHEQRRQREHQIARSA